MAIAVRENEKGNDSEPLQKVRSVGRLTDSTQTIYWGGGQDSLKREICENDIILAEIRSIKPKRGRRRIDMSANQEISRDITALTGY